MPRMQIHGEHTDYTIVYITKRKNECVSLPFPGVLHRCTYTEAASWGYARLAQSSFDCLSPTIGNAQQTEYSVAVNSRTITFILRLTQQRSLMKRFSLYRSKHCEVVAVAHDILATISLSFYIPAFPLSECESRGK